MKELKSTDNQKFEVRELGDADYSAWDEFVKNHEDGTFFHLSGWKKILEEALGHRTFYLACKKGGQIVAVLPLARVKSLLFGDALISSPFLVYGGVIATSDDAYIALVEAATEIGQKLGVDYVEFRNRSPSELVWHKSSKYVTFRKRLDPDPEQNLLAIPRKQRAMIRKGIKAGLKAEFDADIGQFYEALLACKRNLGTPFFSRKYFRAIRDEFGDNVEITSIVKDRQVICSVMSFRFRNEILPYYGGGGHVARNVKGNDFMYWAVMEKACTNGVEIFDYGRSMSGTGAYRFKTHWGFEPTPLSYEYLLIRQKDLPDLNPANPKYRLLINAWQRLPLKLAGLLGPPIARRIG